MKNKEIDFLLRSLDEELAEKESAKVERLLQASQEARSEITQYRDMRKLIAQYGGSTFSPFFADRVMRAVTYPNRQRPGILQRFFLNSFSLQGAGLSLAVILVFVAVGMALWMRPRVWEVPYGQTAVVNLPDGSIVELGSGSTLQYRPFFMRNERRTQLTGEAFFNVVRDDKPFVVETFNTRVIVRGTQFNVRAWPEDLEHETSITLAAGRVEVIPRVAASEPVTLLPGQSTRVVADTSRPQMPVTVPLQQALAWRTGGFSFQDQSLGSVIRALERRFDIEISLDSPDLANLPVAYLNPRPVPVSDVLADIVHVKGLHFRRSANGYHILRQ